MAEGGDIGYEFSFYYDSSEEIRTINCDPCNFEDKIEEADGFCINCDEYLCRSCLQSHQKFRAFRTHNLLYGDSMPKRRSQGREYMCTLFSYCEAHPTNQVQHYCKSHQAVYCRICQTTKHSTCESQEISQVTDTERDRSKLHKTVTQIEDLQISFENLKEADGTTIDQLQARTQSSHAGLKHLQEKMNHIFKNLQEEIKREEKKTEEHIKFIREKFAVSTDAVNHISSFRRNISQIEASNESAVVFAALVKSMNIASDYKEVKTTIEQHYSRCETSNISTGIKQVMGMCEEIVKLLEKLKPTEETDKIQTDQPILPKVTRNTPEKLKSKEETDEILTDQPILPKTTRNTPEKLKSKEETDRILTDQPILPKATRNTPEKQHPGKGKVEIQQTNIEKTQDKDMLTERRTQLVQLTEGIEAEANAIASYKEKVTGKNEMHAGNSLSTPEKKEDTTMKGQGTEREAADSSTPEKGKKSLIDLAVFSKSKRNIQTSDSGVKCDITGCLFLTNGSLILCDHAHSNVILLDDEFNVTDKLYLKGNVWDVASSGKNEVIVSLVCAKRLEFVRIISGKLYHIKGMDLKRVCWGVASDGDNIFLACHNNPGNGMVEIRKKTGQIVKQITLIDEGIELLMPYYISLEQSNSCIYISDAKQNSIICVTMKGKVLAKIKKDSLKWPRAMLVGENQTLAICSSFSNSLVLLRPLNGQWLSKPLLHIERPQAVSMRWQDKTMVIATNQSNTITILKCTG